MSQAHMPTDPEHETGRNGQETFRRRPDGVPIPPPDDPAWTGGESDRSGWAEHDPQRRNRSAQGDRLASSYTYAIPTVEDKPLRERPLAQAIEIIAQTLPILAASLHDFHDHKLLPTLRRFKQVQAEEEDKVVRRDAYARGWNADIEAAQNALRAERDAATLDDREALLALDEPLAQAHADTGTKVARTGGVYDPARPDPSCVLRHAPRSLEVLAGAERKPGPHRDAHAHPDGWIVWTLTVGIGMFIGLSLGLFSGLLHLRAVLHDGLLSSEGALMGVWMAGGAVISLAIKSGLSLLWYHVGQDYALGVPLRKWRATLSIAALITLLLSSADIAVERQGLLAMAQLNRATDALSGRVTQPGLLEILVPWLVGILITLGYLAWISAAAFLRGRQEENVHQLQALQDTDFSARDTQVRADGDNQVALESIAHVHDVQRQQAALNTRIAEIAAPLDQRIAALENERLPEYVPLSETARQRIQDALDNLHGAQAVFDGMFHEAQQRCEGRSGFWGRLLECFIGLRRPRRSDRDRNS